MKYFTASIALLVGLTTFGCSDKSFSHIGMSFKEWDKLGMSFKEWDKQCHWGMYRQSILVWAEGNLEVYTCQTLMPDLFYYFEDGILVRVDQGQHYKRRIAVEIKKSSYE